MRCSQPQGLPGDAIEFLKNEAKPVNMCGCCKRHDGYHRTPIDTYGMFDELELYQYRLKNGKTAKEYVQCSIWSSGPMIWLGLLLDDGTKLEWPEEIFEEVG
jgi:hypothetical protein